MRTQIQVYAVNVMTHVIALEGDNMARGRYDPCYSIGGGQYGQGTL